MEYKLVQKAHNVLEAIEKFEEELTSEKEGRVFVEHYLDYDDLDISWDKQFPGTIEEASHFSILVALLSICSQLGDLISESMDEVGRMERKVNATQKVSEE